MRGAGELEGQPWRDVLARRMALISLPLLLLGVVGAWYALDRPSGRYVVLGVVLPVVSLLALSAFAGWPRGRALYWEIPFGFLIASSAGYAVVGFLAAPGVVLAIAVLLSGLLLGYRGLLVLSISGALSVALVATAVLEGWIPPPDPASITPTEARNWVRTNAIAFLGMAMIGLVATQVVERIEAAFERARRETELRIAAEQDRLEAQRRAMEAQKLEIVGQLAAGVAHDFNNTLTVVLGAAEAIALDLAPSSPSQGLVVMIRDATTHAGQLTRQLLAFSRKARTVSRPFDVHQAIEDSVALLRRSLDRRIRVVTELSAPSSTVIGDPGLVFNAFLNLAINARDAMPAGGDLRFATASAQVEAEEAARHEIEPGPYIRVSITDTGAGMSAEVLAHIFEPFFTTKPIGQGTGLGLAAVFGTVKDHRGAIVASSQPGAGSTFDILLPIAAGSTDPEPRPGPRPRQELGGGRALVVDDEPLVRRSIASQLGHLGYEAVTAEGGAEALALLRQDPAAFTAVVLDLMMPGMSGKQVLLAIREIAPGLPVILCSGYSSEGGLGELLEPGMVESLAKPFTREELTGVLAKLRKKRST
ncbi:MAG: response regulator [Deltaproteobacteria bacterium]|nr:response regulator [Deltaproteobacteria bacterium]